MSCRIDSRVIAGTFTLDGETHEVENNLWVVGDDDECVVIDAPHHLNPILEVVADRRVLAIVCTHAHDDHVRVAPALAEAVGAPLWLHPEDRVLWDLVHPDRAPDADLTDGQVIEVAGLDLHVLHTPGHAPGAVCVHAPALGDHGTLFSGDTLFSGGPGATGRSYSSREVIERSIAERLFPLPPQTVVLTGHGEATTIGAEAERFG